MRSACIFFVLNVLTHPVSAQQWAQQAKAAVVQPLKVTVQPTQQGQRAGSAVDVEVQLQNGKGESKPSSNDTTVEVDLLDPADKVMETSTCKIQAQSAATRCSFQPLESGIYKLRARPKEGSLLGGTGLLLIRPKKEGGHKSAAHQSPAKKTSVIRPPLSDAFDALLLNVAFGQGGGPPAPVPDPAHDCEGGVSHSPARLILKVTGGSEDGGAFKAGIENAVIQAFYVAGDGGSAPGDIRVWLSQDHGTLKPQFILIPKCGISGEAQLSAPYPVTATITYSVAPKLPVDAPPSLSVTFVRHIIGIGIMPAGLQTLSLIDRGRLIAEFYDAEGNTVATTTPRTVQFISNTSAVYPRDGSVTVNANSLSAETVLLPFWVGSGSIVASADHLRASGEHKVRVVGVLVILLCLGGGALGGVAAFYASGGKIIDRVVIGVAAAIVLSWAYVFGLLPKVDSVVAHNMFTVLAISILGGYLGIKALDMVRRQLGWAT